MKIILLLGNEVAESHIMSSPLYVTCNNHWLPVYT